MRDRPLYSSGFFVIGNIRTAAFLNDYGEKRRKTGAVRGRFSVIGRFAMITPTKWRKVTV